MPSIRTSTIFSVLGAALFAMLTAPGPACSEEEHPTGRTRDALLAAWERAQQDEPNVEILEQLGPGLYRFKTTWFPFDGQLRVLNVSIDQREAFNEYDYPTGVVEVELVDMPEDFWQKHSHSVGLWMQTNSLFFDTQNDRWLTNREWQAQLNEEMPYGYGGLVKWANWIWLGVPILLILLLLGVIRKTHGQFKKAMSAQDEAMAGQRTALEQSSQALALSKSTNRLLEEILQELKRAS